MKNRIADELKMYARNASVPLWAVAEKVGVSEFTFSRLLRHITEEEKEKYCHVIDDIKAGEENDRN